MKCPNCGTEKKENPMHRQEIIKAELENLITMHIPDFVEDKLDHRARLIMRRLSEMGVVIEVEGELETIPLTDRRRWA